MSSLKPTLEDEDVYSPGETPKMAATVALWKKIDWICTLNQRRWCKSTSKTGKLSKYNKTHHTVEISAALFSKILLPDYGYDLKILWTREKTRKVFIYVVKFLSQI